MNIRYINPDDLPPDWSPYWAENSLIAESNGVQVIARDEDCELYVVRNGEIVRRYELTQFVEEDGPALAEEVDAFLEDAREDDSD